MLQIKDPQIFVFQVNGKKYAFDPLDANEQLLSCPELTSTNIKTLQAFKDIGKSKTDNTDVILKMKPEVMRINKAILDTARKTFGLEALHFEEEEVKGCTDEQVWDIINELFKYVDGLKKNIGKRHSSPTSTASTSTTPKTTNSFAASTLTQAVVSPKPVSARK